MKKTNRGGSTEASKRKKPPYPLTGFTILELVVVLGIIALMSGIVLVSLERGRAALAVDRAANQVAQDLRIAMEYALRARNHTCTLGSLEAYGIFADKQVATSYILFADCNDDRVFKTPALDPLKYDDVVDLIVLEKGVRIKDTKPTAGAPFPGSSIAFEPPDPIVTFKRSTGAAGPQGEITLESVRDSSITRTVEVNNRGSVRVK